MTTIAFPRETLLMPAARPSSMGRSLGLAFAFSLLIAASAQIRIPLPFTPVPITGQTFAVLLCGALLGSRWGALAVVLYLAEGAMGLPFFTGAASGLAYLLGAKTAGYLFGFLPGAWLAGILCERGWDKSVPRAALAMSLGSLVISGCGWIVLSHLIGASTAFTGGVLPFLPGDALKIALAAALLPLGWQLTQRQAQ